MSSVESMRNFLGTNLRILLDDGRVVQGGMECMDRELNFVLSDTLEYHNAADYLSQPTIPDAIVMRRLGQAMIPGKHVVQVFSIPENKV